MRVLAAALLLAGAPAFARETYDPKQMNLVLDAFREIAAIAVSVCEAAQQSGYRESESTAQKTTTGVGNLTQLLLNASTETVQQSVVVRWQGEMQDDIAGPIKETNECRYRIVTSLQRTVFDIAIPLPSRAMARPEAASPATPPPAQVTPSKPEGGIGRPTLQVFLKDNLTERNLTVLKTLLPNFNTVIGRSAIDKRNPADTLFVNRDEITPAQVLEVVRAVGSMGIPIKSVQQSSIFKGREIQIGTIPSQFWDTPPLDLDALSHLDGPAFWTAAFNGKVFCNTGVGAGRLCEADPDGRPVAIH
jgi:hypothetical protein